MRVRKAVDTKRTKKAKIKGQKLRFRSVDSNKNRTKKAKMRARKAVDTKRAKKAKIKGQKLRFRSVDSNKLTKNRTKKVKMRARKAVDTKRTKKAKIKGQKLRFRSVDNNICIMYVGNYLPWGLRPRAKKFSSEFSTRGLQP